MATQTVMNAIGGGSDDTNVHVLAMEQSRMVDLNKPLARASPPLADEIREMWNVWLQHVAEVDRLASTRHIISRADDHRAAKFCHGCGRLKDGHKRTQVHTKCIRPLCWCGIHRLLHPFPLIAGVKCRGEWRRLLEEKAPELLQAAAPMDEPPGNRHPSSIQADAEAAAATALVSVPLGVDNKKLTVHHQ